MVPLIQGSEPARRTHLNGLEGEQSSSKHRLLVTFVPLKPLKVPVLMYVLNVGDERSSIRAVAQSVVVVVDSSSSIHLPSSSQTRVYRFTACNGHHSLIYL